MLNLLHRAKGTDLVVGGVDRDPPRGARYPPVGRIDVGVALRVEGVRSRVGEQRSAVRRSIAAGRSISDRYRLGDRSAAVPRALVEVDVRVALGIDRRPPRPVDRQPTSWRAGRPIDRRSAGRRARAGRADLADRRDRRTDPRPVSRRDRQPGLSRPGADRQAGNRRIPIVSRRPRRLLTDRRVIVIAVAVVVVVDDRLNVIVTRFVSVIETIARGRRGIVGRKRRSRVRHGGRTIGRTVSLASYKGVLAGEEKMVVAQQTGTGQRAVTGHVGGDRLGHTLGLGEQSSGCPVTAENGPRRLVGDSKYRSWIPVVEIVEVVRSRDALPFSLLPRGVCTSYLDRWLTRMAR